MNHEPRAIGRGRAPPLPRDAASCERHCRRGPTGREMIYYSAESHGRPSWCSNRRSRSANCADIPSTSLGRATPGTAALVLGSSGRSTREGRRGTGTSGRRPGDAESRRRPSPPASASGGQQALSAHLMASMPPSHLRPPRRAYFFFFMKTPISRTTMPRMSSARNPML